MDREYDPRVVMHPNDYKVLKEIIERTDDEPAGWAEELKRDIRRRIKEEGAGYADQ